MNTKSAFIAVTGRPNAGKSSLVNLLVGEKVAIVSEKPQTTRTRINGVLTKDEVQYVFIDTPGMHKARNKLSDNMVRTIKDSVDDVDAIILMTDASKGVSPIEKSLIESFAARNADVILLINKVDLLKDKTVLLSLIDTYRAMFDFAQIIPISVKNQINTDEIMPVLEKYAKDGPHYFDDDLPTDQTERVWLAELIREKILRNMQEEIPHGTAVYIESLETRKTRAGKDIVDIGAVILCEKASHKGMIIGRQGDMLKKIGTLAREEMEDYFDCKVNMKLWVKVREDWRNKESVIADLGLKAD